MSLPRDSRFKPLKNRNKRIVFFVSLGVLAASGVVFAAVKMVEQAIKRDGRETRVNVLMSVPNGTLTMLAGTAPGDVALLQMQSQDEDDPLPFHVRHNYNPVGTTFTLRMTIGSDEGMLETNPPLAQGWKANSNFSLARSNAVHSDGGDMSPSNHSLDFMNAPPQPAPVSDDKDHATVYLTREIPVSISAQLGYGESMLDWTGLSLTSAYVETGAAKAHIGIREHNPIPMSFCKINAGFGEFSMDGISDLNADKFVFSGGVGYYALGFNGKLTKNLDATVEVGMGKVSLNIPPEAGRVRVIYDDSFFSSFSFSGLVKRREGYYTSVGFDQSNAPILTLRLSSGLGKMIVNYK